MPICGHPIIAGITAKDWTGLKTNHRFAAVPIATCPSVAGGNERIGAIAGDAANSPYRTAVGAGSGSRSPRCYCAGWIWIIYRYPHQPAMIRAAIVHASIPDIKNAVHDAKRRSLLLDLRGEG